MSTILRSARPAVRRTTVMLVPRVAVVPARRLATDAKQHNKQQHDQHHNQQHNQQKQAPQQQQQQQQQSESQEGNIWATPLKTPLKAAAGEVLTDVVGAAASIKDSVKAKITNSSATEQIREKAHELGSKARAAASSASEQLGDIIDPKGAGKGNDQRAFSTSSSRSASRDSERAAKDLQDDATRMKQKVQNRSAQAGIELKEQGQSMMHGVKKTARAVGAAVTDAIDSAASTVTGGEKRDATNDPELSTSKRPGNVIGGSTDSNLGEGQESVKKSFLDGPQVMPQGVGKRAKDDEGKPMEQGSPRT